MTLRHAVFAVLVVVGCSLIGCAKPPPLSPEAASVTVNDGRSIEHCATLGIVSASDPASIFATRGSERYTSPQLRNQVAERGGNYLETMLPTCPDEGACAQSGVAYRCPEVSKPVDAT